METVHAVCTVSGSTNTLLMHAGGPSVSSGPGPHCQRAGVRTCTGEKGISMQNCCWALFGLVDEEQLQSMLTNRGTSEI